MTNEQRQLYRAALTIGRKFGVGGGSWLYAPPPSQDGVTETPSFFSDGLRSCYVVRERVVAYGQASPPATVGVDRWRLIGKIGEDLAAGGLITNGDRAFSLGPIESDQGYPTGIVEEAALPDLNTLPVSNGGLRTGLRIGL
jgi:hypothetical protein